MVAATMNAIPVFAYALPLIAIIALVLIKSTFKILREYERAVVFQLGRFQQVKGPGPVLLIPFIQEMVRVSTCASRSSRSRARTSSRATTCR